MNKNLQHTITIKDLRNLIREELIREMQEPVDLALVGDVDDLPADMVTELPRPNHSKLPELSEQTAHREKTGKSNETVNPATTSKRLTSFASYDE